MGSIKRVLPPAESPMQDVDHSKDDMPRNRFYEDFIAALENTQGLVGSNSPQNAGILRVRKVKIIIEDFEGNRDDLGEAIEEYAYVGAMPE
ncbi:hypothetical protein AC579_9146 [Pseudocercospora musae]|uniref:Uncharacterized protein n=1 Tax=Pseudocercospora musae TaxID=113226 RepID=A0A139IJ36_9PEZI|nr:hypothetical protein AC579_9146 [Pseudocercospora musae]